MAKKNMFGSAEYLIDSLLDNKSGSDSARAKPQPPALPKNVYQSAKDEEDDQSIVFEMDPEQAQPTRSLKLVVDQPKSSPVTKKPMPPEPTMLMSKPAVTKPSTSELRHAETIVQKAEASSSDVSFDLPGLDEPAASDKTVRLPSSSGVSEKPRFENSVKNQNVYSAPAASSAMQASPADLVLRQTEGLRIAQARIHELEAELDRLRRESEKLASAGETLRRRTDELLAKSENLENRLHETQTTSEEEKKIMRSQLNARDRENMDLKSKLEEAETRLEGNFKKIRVRERELEHRLEIVKMESQTLVSTKDDMIMRLKREIDQMKFEIENSKVRSQELYNQYKEKQETARRVVRALRIALTILEGDEDPGLKKAE
jgi:hypothetical protein